MIDKNLLEILACPKCKGDLIYTEKEFICLSCKLLFKIEDDIPNFLIDEAIKLNDEDLEKYKKYIEK